MKAAVYARVSTLDQEPENQLQELRRYVQARAWTAVEYVDRGVSGAKDRRPALDLMLTDARRRRFDVVVCWRLDRLGRNLKHLITLLEELQALGVAFVSLAEGIDATTPAGKLQMHILGAIAEFERERIRERVLAGLQRARIQGKRLGRPKTRPPIERLEKLAGLPVHVAAERLGVSRSTVKRWRRQVQQTVCTISISSCEKFEFPILTDENNEYGQRSRRLTLANRGAKLLEVVMEVFPGITMNPDVRFGKPCIAGTRMDVATVVGLFAAGETIDTVMAEYDLAADQVRAALAYAAHVAAHLPPAVRHAS